MSHSEFTALVKKGEVSNLTLDKQTITGTLAVQGLEGVLSNEKIQVLKRQRSEGERKSRRPGRVSRDPRN